MDPRERIEQLRREIDDHNYRYYVDNQPIVSDEEFYSLVRELEQLER
jgi:DNA ligase (NAD+)